MSGPEIEGRGGICAKVIAYSLSPVPGVKPLITLQLRYPRFIHSEFMTHRAFSRNASSSRAIPVEKMLEQVRNEPAMPIHWGKNQPGMQANEELVDHELQEAEMAWLHAAHSAADRATHLRELGLHKQVANRLLEPFQFISVIVTATEWENFFQLRDHEDAQPEIRELAQVMKCAICAAKAKQLQMGEWHLPYVSAKELNAHGVDLCRKVSAARCARVSYLTHDGKTPSVEKDIALFERLVGSVPLHASPIEHQGTPSPESWFPGVNKALEGNFEGWTQFRKLHEQTIYKEVA